jgi:hypothetical protein
VETIKETADAGASDSATVASRDVSPTILLTRLAEHDHEGLSEPSSLYYVERRLSEDAMKALREIDRPTIEALRPRPSVLKRVHGLTRHRGKVAAIEPESGDYFLGESLLEALDRGREKYPAGVFYFVRIGHPTTHVHRGGPRRDLR